MVAHPEMIAATPFLRNSDEHHVNVITSVTTTGIIQQRVKQARDRLQ